MASTPRKVLFVQLPIPPLSPAPIRGNVPLAAAYLKLFANNLGLAHDYCIDILPTPLANTRGDQGLVAAILERDPWMVGFTCYVWNIERTLWISQELKRQRPGLRIVLGGPEITADNSWVLDTPDYDFAVIGEGEQTFANLLLGVLDGDVPPVPIPGLYLPAPGPVRYDPARRPAFRTPLPDLNRLGSPYLAGILDAAEEKILLLETTRGCVFKCKFCYYPKAYDQQYFVGPDLIRASLAHARERGAEEVFLLDPTLNQRKDFADLLRLLAEGNPGRQFSYTGELRAEGITETTAGLLREANFVEVEVGLQSIDPDAMHKMDRKNNLKAFERGVRAMLGEGISVKVDLIVGLPGDTLDSVQRGFHYLHDNALFQNVQVFNLSILPGTDFRHEAEQLGLTYQPRPPYYVLRTPTLARQDLFGLIQEAQELFQVEFDPPPPPVLDFSSGSARDSFPALAVRAGHDRMSCWHVDLDDGGLPPTPPADSWAQAFTLWLQSADFDVRRREAAALIERVLQANPFTTLQVVLEPGPNQKAEQIRESLSARLLDMLTSACQSRPTYLDKYLALQPGRPNGAKRLILLLPMAKRTQLDADWLAELAGWATVVWRGTGQESESMEAHEYAWVTD
jgi:radical SAM superfamily enzyme YgiQ (UPF0313 family)